MLPRGRKVVTGAAHPRVKFPVRSRRYFTQAGQMGRDMLAARMILTGFGGKHMHARAQQHASAGDVKHRRSRWLGRALMLGVLAGALSLAGPVAMAGAAPTNCPCTLFSASDTPAVASFDDNNAVELGVAFNTDTDGYIDAVRFYKGAENTGTHIGSLWATDGTLLAQATFTNESPSGWQQVNFPTPVPVTAGTAYIASYHTDVGEYATTPYYFSDFSLANSPLYAPGGDQGNPNGLFAYSPVPTFPTGTYNGNNYWVDVVFTPTPLPASIAVSAPTASPVDGTTEQLSATASFGDGTTSDITSQVSWSSSAPTVAGVSASGALSALSVGPTTATASLYGVSGSLNLNVTPSPTVTGVAPSSGSTVGGNLVTISGTDFATGDAVSFGGTASSTVSVTSPTSITAAAPPGAAGPVDVTVTDPTSLVTSPTSPADAYTYITPPPTVTGVSPASGPATGGTPVAIAGTGFVSGSTVSFGGAAATGVTVNSPTSISATDPAGAIGPVDVTVTNVNGTSLTSPADTFTYAAVAPAITTQPASQTVGVGQTATFTAAASGTPTPTVTWQLSHNGGSTWTNVAGANSTSLVVASVTATQSGTQYRALFTNSAGSAATQSATLSVVPVVTGVLPARGVPLSLVIITGRGFSHATSVNFGGHAAPIFLVLSDQIIVALAPVESPATVDVTVHGVGGTSLPSSADRFAVL